MGKEESIGLKQLHLHAFSPFFSFFLLYSFLAPPLSPFLHPQVSTVGLPPYHRHRHSLPRLTRLPSLPHFTSYSRSTLAPPFLPLHCLRLPLTQHFFSLSPFFYLFIMLFTTKKLLILFTVLSLSQQQFACAQQQQPTGTTSAADPVPTFDNNTPGIYVQSSVNGVSIHPEGILPIALNIVGRRPVSASCLLFVFYSFADCFLTGPSKACLFLHTIEEEAKMLHCQFLFFHSPLHN